MAEVRPPNWFCTNCHTGVKGELPTCPKCHKRAPLVAGPVDYQQMVTWPSSYSGTHYMISHPQIQTNLSSNCDPLPSVEQVNAGTVTHAESGTMSQKELAATQFESIQTVRQNCARCGHTLVQQSKFCSECGVPTHPTPPDSVQPPSVQALQPYSSNECYFCEEEQAQPGFNITRQGKMCKYCSRKQPNEPQGPPCVHGCGARLIKPSAKVCGRCGKSQTRRSGQASQRTTETQPLHSSLPISEPPFWPSTTYHTGYSYPNSPTVSGRFTGYPIHQIYRPPIPYPMPQPRPTHWEQRPPLTQLPIASESIFQLPPYVCVTTTSGSQSVSGQKTDFLSQPVSSYPLGAQPTKVESSNHPHHGSPIQETAQNLAQQKHEGDGFSGTANVASSRKRKMPNNFDSDNSATPNKPEKAGHKVLKVEHQADLSSGNGIASMSGTANTLQSNVQSPLEVGGTAKSFKLDTLESTPVALDSTRSCSAPGSAVTTTVATAGAGKTAASPSSKQTEEGDMYKKNASAPELLPAKVKPKKKDSSKKHSEAKKERRSVTCLDGINAPRTKSVKLTFHVLVPKPCWEWNETSSVHIRFGHSKLGDWTDCATLHEMRRFDDELSEMICTFETFDKEILQAPLPYKYVIHSPKSKKREETECYEYLHWKNQECNRCLDVPAVDRHFTTGEYHKYDTIAYPKDTKLPRSVTAYLLDHAPSFVTKIFQRNKEKEGGQEEGPGGFTPMTPLEMCMYSLDCYLTHFRDMLCTESYGGNDFNIREVATKISFIYNSLLKQRICPMENQISSMDFQIDEAAYNHKLQEWFESVIIELKENTALDPTTKLTSATCILFCITTSSTGVLNSLDSAYLLPLAGMLRMHPQRDVKAEYQCVCSKIPAADKRPAVADAISKLCLQLSKKTKHFAIEWLLPIPLYHFLLEKSEPCGPASLELDIEWKWYNLKFGLTSIHQKAQKKDCFVATYYDQVKSYFAIDPLLLKVFVFLAPWKEFVELCNRIPAYLSLEVLIEQAINSASIEEKVWSKNLEQVKLACVLAHNPPLEHLSAMVRSSLNLCSKLSERLLSSKESKVKVLNGAFSCALCVLQSTHVPSLFENEHGRTVREKALTKMDEILNKWIAKQEVIGGSIFGHTVQSYGYQTRSGWKGKQELTVWQCLLSVNIPLEYQSLKDWHNVIGSLVTRRIYAVSAEKTKIDLVIEMEKMESVHTVLEGLIMDAALKAIDNLLNKSGNEIERLAMEQSERVGKLLGRIFDKNYPDLHFEPTLTDLFEWTHWARYIKICEQPQKLRQGLSKNCTEACRSAKKTVLSLCKRLQCGNVSINELEVVRDKIDRMQQLFESCSDEADSNKNVEALAALQSAVTHRKEEYTTFLRHHRRLQHLCRFLNAEIEGFNELQCELEKNYDDVNLNELCSRDCKTQKVQVICFKSSDALHTFVDSFYVLSKQYANDLFPAAWKKFLTSALNTNPNLGLEDIYSSLWLPSLNFCRELLHTLSDLSIPLGVVDQVFKDHKADIETQLLQLFKGVSECPQVSESFNHSLIERAVVRIKQYWEVCRYREGANIILRIRNSLGLHGGDFNLVEKLSRELAESSQCQTLGDVDDRLVGAGVFLEDVANDPKKVQCLDTFARCKDIVKWLKDVTKGEKEIQHFVNVALTTAAGGEGDLSHDKLSVLRTVGSGFASLIYDFPKESGFVEFKEACTFVWEALDKNENLPSLLEDCNKDVEWYQSVKDTQGSVEVTSYGQMRNILQYGRYQVGTTVQSKPVHGIHDLISLKLILRDKKVSKTLYNLDDLRDLESKLVLITGSKAENRTEVDHYLNILQYVTRIAEVLLALQQAGNVAYSGWVITIDCAMYFVEEGGLKQEPQLKEDLAKMLVDELSSCAKEMEQALENWNNKVKESRSQYYELNYYTARQLLRLRRELRLTENNCKSVNPDVLALLHSISQDVTPENVLSIMSVIRKERIQHPAVCEGELQYETTPSDVLLSELHIANNKSSIPTFNVAEIVTSPKASDSETTVSISENVKPQLTEHDINAEQQNILTDLVEYAHYPKQLVLKAFERCNNPENFYDVQSWCDENENDHEHNNETKSVTSDDLSSESEMASSESDEEQESQTVFVQHSASASSATIVKNKSSTSSAVNVVHRQIINEAHPLVQQLVEEYEYGLEDSIDAVSMTRYWGTIDKAMDYLAERDTENGEEVLLKKPVMGLGLLEGIQSKSGEHVVIYNDNEAEENVLSLDELGTVLKRLSEQLPESVKQRRTFLEELKTSNPNLIVSRPADIWRTVLTLYMEDQALPLPTFEEVLVCNSSTTAEEINLFWQRAIGDPDFNRIFCLVHAETLSYQTCDNVVENLKELTQGKQGYRLVIVCSKDAEHNSHIVSKLLLHKRSIVLKHSDKKFQNYLRGHFIHDEACTPATVQMASCVDYELSCVRVVSSERTGMGKSLFIQRMAEQLSEITTSSPRDVKAVIPIHGPLTTADVILNFLKEHYNDNKCKIYHFDVAPTILHEVDTILFSLLILHGLTDSQGCVWRCHPAELYAVETTLKKAKDNILSEARTLDLLHLLPGVECLSPVQVLETENPSRSQIRMDEEEFRTPTYQRVYQYLRRNASNESLDHFLFAGHAEGTTADCLQLFIKNCGVQDPSWSEIYHFTKFLDLQLEACEKSVFCDAAIVEDVMNGFKSFVVKFMITMSRDFATPSLRGEVSRESQPAQLEKYEIEKRRRWEESSHPYIFFNEDGNTITFLGFIITRNGDLVYPRHQARFMEKQLFKGLSRQGVNFADDYRKWSKTTMIEKLSLVMGLDYVYDPDDTYVLTVDNLIKILAIQMRFRCGIPVVIMGETGCGKTRLIRYMCDLAREGRGGRNMLIMKIHGGTKESDIVDFIDVAEKESEKNKANKMDTIVFFDEANTTDALGMIKEIMCDRRIHGRPVSDDLKFIAACNPYRKHSDEMIRRLETAGLGFYVRTTETQQRLGNIPLRQLVYRVLDLPHSMRPLVYDFGQLKTGTEEDYIKQIVHDHIRKHNRLSLFAEHAAIEPVIVEVLATSQSYMRRKEDECSFVSLRDVERAMIVFEYFFEKIDDFRQADQEKKKAELNPDQVSGGTRSYQGMSVCELEKLLEELQNTMGKVITDEHPLGDAVTNIPKEEHPNVVTTDMSKDELAAQISDIKKILKERNLQNTTTALILAVSVCYHARLQERKEYEGIVASKFTEPMALGECAAQLFRNEIMWCQTVLLDNMELGTNIAKNAALRENVFMMAICIELRIPLFLVGKPGSSKSLAKSIIQDSMHGKTSHSNLLKKFKQVQMLSYQCSQLATPESVIEVFKSAKKFQSTQDTSMYVSVVVLDEVGLAEDSPNLPLKALHPLLEDGTEGAGAEGRDEVIKREQRVAFIGISNWALDPAKMNRGVMVIRGSPDIEELKFSAEGICGKDADDTTKEKLEPYFKDLAKAYEAICAKQDREFFGLRDFYSLIKMLYWMCKNSKGHPLTWAQLEHAIKRNFGGLESSKWNPFQEFKKRLNLPEEQLDRKEYDDQTWELINPNCSRLALIKTSLATKETTFHGENRYLLFLTENYAALDILEHYIRGKEQESTMPLGTGLEGAETSTTALKPFTLFGSSFPKDKEYTQVCRNINQIKICMETGRTVILLNLENLYESLYDVLNQYYMRYGDNRYVDLGLQSHRVKCRVHKDFKLILIAERHTVDEKFPTPLINRLEKHFVLTSSVLKEWQLDVLDTFLDWIKQFSVIRDYSENRSFKEEQAFIGYQKDTPAAVIFQASRQLKQLRRGNCQELDSLQKYSIFQDIHLPTISTEQKGSYWWKLAVLKLSQILLLQIASDDALIRLKKTTLAEQQEEFLELYFSQQCHNSVIDLVRHYITSVERSREGLLMQVTTHGHLLQREEIETVGKSLHMRVEAFPVLQEFDTELDFTNKISPLFQGGDDCLIVIQCDAGHIYGDLIACARYRIYDERVKAQKKNKIQSRAGVTHVLLIINLPHHVSSSSFVGFQGDPWVSYHIDDLMPTFRDTIEPVQAIKKTISDLFIGSYIHDIIPIVPQPQKHLSVTESDNSSESPDEHPLLPSSFSTTERQVNENEHGLETEDNSEQDSDEHSITTGTQSDGELGKEDSSTNKTHNIEETGSNSGSMASIDEEMKVVDIEDHDLEYGTETFTENLGSHTMEAPTQRYSLTEAHMSLPVCMSLSKEEVLIRDEHLPQVETEKPELGLSTCATMQQSTLSDIDDGFSHHALNDPPHVELASTEINSDTPINQNDLATQSPPYIDTESKSYPQEKDALHVDQAIPEIESDYLIQRGDSPMQIPLTILTDTPSDQEERLPDNEENEPLQGEVNQVPDPEPCPPERNNSSYHSNPDTPILKQTAHITPVGQCRRLYGCIQAAASKLEDMTKDRSTQRVSRLTKLIPRDPAECIDVSSFYGVLVMHLYKLLQEREADRPDLCEWVLNEALNVSKLEVGGTFRNVLARKIDEVVIPIFAKIIACIDYNYNLDLIDPKSENSPRSQFWLAMFREPEVLQLKYSEMQGDTVPGVGGRKANKDFRCKMPFFWLIKETVDSQWDSARSTTDTNKLSHHRQLSEFIQATHVGAILESVNPENYEEFYEDYLHDFLKSVHKCKHRNPEHDDQEYQLISDALNHLVHCSETYQQSLISRIAALHVVHWENRSQILWFGQLVSHSPSIMKNMLDVSPQDEFPEMELHLYAAINVMEQLEPPLQKDNPNPNLSLWLNRIRLCRNAIKSIITLRSKSKLVDKARFCWQRLHATQLFVEHVMLAHPTIDLKVTARRMSKLWERNADFLQAKTINSVQLQLNSMERILRKDGNDKHIIKQIKKCCRQFFVEMVSDLSFGGPTVPEPELIKMLLGTIFVKKDESTQELTPYKDDKSATDKIPTIRSFLLQLLLEHSLDEVRGHLHDYLDRSHHVLSGKVVSVDQNLYLLVIQCLEDSLTKKFTAHSLPSKAHEATNTLLEGFYALQETGCQDSPSFEYLEGIAKVRFALSVVAEVLNSEENIQFVKLLRAGGKVCSDHQINCIDTTGRKNTVGPVIYLLKLMVRRYGMPRLKAAAEIHEWLIPFELKSEEEKLVDPFVIYDDKYKKLKESVNNAMYGNQLEELYETTKNLKTKELVYLLLTLFEKVTLSRTNTNPARRINNEALERLNEFVLNYQHFPNELRFTARALLANHQGGTVLEQMSVSPQQTLHCRTIMGVVIHAVAVFFGRQKLDILLPFINMLNNPAALNHSFLPTMPEDQVIATQDAMRTSDPNGKFYECPRGHKYFVGDCGGVMSTGVCNICRAPIGGRDYNLQQDNQLANLYDTTKTGYDLGDPNSRTDTTPERDLSPRAVCILRALMHSAFIWASCNNDQALGAIAGLVKLHVQPQQLPEFFWTQLEKDVELLGKDTNKGLEESVMIIHLVLRQILTANPPTDAGNVLAVNTLVTKEARMRWEVVFNQHYIQPVLANLDNNLTAAMDIVANDDQQDHDQLFFLAYEKIKHVDDSLEPHMWTYRTRITLEHLRQSIHDKKLTQTYPILHEFLQAEMDLRATQYLPEVIHLQRCLYDKFNRQIDRKDSKKQTIAVFVQSLPNETVKNDYRIMIGCLKAAWNLVGHKLKNHGRIPIEEKFYIAHIDDSTPMEYLVPTTSEAGVCTTALVDYLTLKHNSFIERCRSLVADNDQSTLSFWREHKVPITHLHHCHLVNYEHKLPAIILSHCHYSLKVGKGQHIKYDYHALEKHILNQFIHGKPLILLDIPQVVYKRDIYTTSSFAAVRKKVAPQDILPQRIRQDIITELCSPDRLREALDVVEIVLGFLSSGGGKAEKPLGEYIDKTLRMRKRHFSNKAKMACQLKHVLSLWETIAVELARQLCLREQEPFDSIRQDFLRELSEDEDGEDQFTALDSCLGQFDPGTLLGTLYEFIETYVKHSPLQEHDESLVATLELVLEQYGIELPHLREFPASIKLNQAVAAWKHIVHHYAQKN